MISTKLSPFQDRYGITITSAGREFLGWVKISNQQINNPNWNWNDVFNAEPYLKYVRNPDGDLYPSMQILAIRIAYEEYPKRYESFIDSLKLSSTLSLQERSQLHNYREMVLNFLRNGIEALEEIDVKIQSVLKVLYFEAEKTAKAKLPDGTMIHQLKEEVKLLYQTGIRRVSSPETLENNWLPKTFENLSVDEIIKESVTDGVLHFVAQKDGIIKNLIPAYEKFLFLESLIKQLLKDENILIGKPEKDIEDAVNDFQKKLLIQSKENEPRRRALIKAAAEIIYDLGSGQLRDYFSEKGNPIKKLWDHPKIGTLNYHIPISTRKVWLKDAYTEGKIQKPANDQLSVS